MDVGWRRFIEPAALLLVAAIVAFDSLSYPSAVVPGAPGPAFLPRLLALGLVSCALLMVARAARASKSVQSVSTDEVGDAVGESVGPVALAMVAVAGFIAAAPRTDTFIVLPLLVAVLMVLMGERRTRPLLAGPLLFSGFVYVVFFRLFGVALPSAW